MAFDLQQAVLYGRFIEAAYAMYEADPANLTPPQPQDFPTGYRLTAWVQMQDFFIFGSTGPVFYGFIAHSDGDPNSAVVAIRGTQSDLEWWDDINSLGMVPFVVPGCGNVGMGWEKIYDTLEVVQRPAAAAAAPQSLKSAGRFSAQVLAHLQHHAVSAGAARTDAASQKLKITGHSLGATLATLCAAENALLYHLPAEALYTFASPKMGDHAFVTAFDNLKLNSWRIINEQDVVQVLPPGFYEHVETPKPLDSRGKVKQSVACCHAITTYLHLLDPSRPPDQGCRLPAPAAVA